jgi:hypothetical protein
VNNELEGMSKEALVAQFEGLSQHLSGWNHEIHAQSQSGLLVEIRTRDLIKKKQEYYPFRLL